jgi:hypothetical protein
VSDHDEHDPFGETQSAPDPLGPFEAFQAQREKEQAPTEPFPEQYASEPTALLPPLEGEPTVQFGPPEAGGYTGYPPPPAPALTQSFEYAEPAPMYPGEPAGAGRGRLRSAMVFGGIAVLVVALGVGVYAATRPSGGQPTAATPPATASAAPSVGASKAAKTGKALTARLTVTTVGTDSFTATTASGTAVSVKIAAGTKFGTAARPFTRSQLVPGAVVFARLRREANGSVVATVIAAGTAVKASASASATPSAGA